MGQKVQREYLKRGNQLTSSEQHAVYLTSGSPSSNQLCKIYVIEDLETGERQVRGSVVAEEELKKP